MKLLLISPSTLRGGVEEYALTIALAAVKEGWEVHAAFPQTDTTVSVIQDFEAKGVHYHRLQIIDKIAGKLKLVGIYLSHLLQTIVLLLKIKPDVVQINLPWCNTCFGSILASGVLMIPTAVVFQLIPYPLEFTSGKLKAYAWARARNQQWIAVSENNRNFVCKSFHIPDDEVLRIYNGAKVMSAENHHTQQDITTLRHQVRQELGVPENARIALTVARLSSQKGHDDLIPAISHLTKDFPDLRFVWVGDGEQRENLANRVREYGVENKVLFLGYRSDVPRFLKSADIFVFPTRFEGQPFALAEAMAHNLPIVTTNASGIPEVIQDKVHGLLYRTGDSCELLEAIRWALKHPTAMQEMAHKAQQRVQEFSEERMVKETLSVLQKLSQASNQVKSTIPKYL